MNKCLVLIIIILGLTSCTVKDEQYYRSHPKELTAAIETCVDKKSNRLTCHQLEEIALQMSQLAYQLQSSPQGFGNKIITLQEKIANEKMKLEKNGPDLQTEKDLEQNQHQLVELLSVVKWLESPEG